MRGFQLLGICIFFAFLAPFVLYGWPSLELLRTSTFCALGDELINLVFVDRISANLFGGRNLFDGRFFYPVQNALTFSENLFLPSFLYRAWYSFTLEKVLSYHLMVFSLFGLNGGAFYFLARKCFSAATSLLAALFFSFSMIRLAQMSHIQLLPQFLFPIAAACFYEYHHSRDIRWMVGAALAIVLQIYSGIYLGLMLLAACGPFLFFEWRFQKKNGHNFAGHLLLAMSIIGICLFPLAWPYYRMSRQFGVVRDIDEARQYSAYVWSYLSAPPSSTFSFLTEWIHWGRFLHEKRLFVGFIVAVFLARPIWEFFFSPLRSFWSRGIGISTLFVAWLSLGPNAVLYALFYFVMPGFKAMRCPARFGMVFLFFAALIAAYGVERWLSRFSTQRVKWFFIAGVAFLFLLENHLSIPLVEIPPYLKGTVQFLAETGDEDPVAHLPLQQEYVPFPKDNGNIKSNREAVRMFYGLFHSHPILNGYSGYFPPRYHEMVAAESRLGPTEAFLDELRRFGIGWVVLEKATFPVSSRDEWEELWNSRSCRYQDSAVCVFRL
jgi:hypothetical protein